jgi:hypothetical protein
VIVVVVVLQHGIGARQRSSLWIAARRKQARLRRGTVEEYTGLLKIEPPQLDELRRICAELAQHAFSDAELQLIAERIVRFLLNSQDCSDLFDLK